VSYVKVVPEFPRTASNKLLRRVLRDQLAQELSNRSKLWPLRLFCLLSTEDFSCVAINDCLNKGGVVYRVFVVDMFCCIIFSKHIKMILRNFPFFIKLQALYARCPFEKGTIVQRTFVKGNTFYLIIWKTKIQRTQMLHCGCVCQMIALMDKPGACMIIYCNFFLERQGKVTSYHTVWTSITS